MNLYSKKKLFGLLTLIIYTVYMTGCFALIIIGNLGIDYRLSYGLSHYIEDLFLSPFVVMMMLLIMVFQKEKIRLKEKLKI